MASIINFGHRDDEIVVTEDYQTLITRLADAGKPRTIDTRGGPSVTLAGWIAATLASGERIEVQAGSIAYVRPES